MSTPAELLPIYGANTPLTLGEQTSTPTAPTNGYVTLYPKNDGKIYKLDSDENEVMIPDKTYIDAQLANSKYMCVYFCDTEYRQSISYFTNFATYAKSAGFKEINILIHVQSNGTTQEDLDKFSDYDSIATEIGIPITCLKVHGTYSYTNYMTKTLLALSKLPNVNTVFIFNEQFASVYAHGLTFPAQIKAAYPNVTKVGCTVDYGTAFKAYVASASDEVSQIQTVYNVLGVHMYPSCGSFVEAKSTTYEQCIKAFNEFTLTIPWTNEMWLTESGVLPYWQFLELPESYSVIPLTDTTRTSEPQKLFYRALANSNIAKEATKVIPWYTESWLYTETLDMWDVIKNIIQK
jgi:hypothetical protein